MSDQTRCEARENFGVRGLFESAFLEVIIVVETDTKDFGWLGHRGKYPYCVQVDCGHRQKVSACAQQICTLRNQFGQSGWKAAFALRKAMPARAVIRRNSGDTPRLEMDNAHRFFLQWRADTYLSASWTARRPCGHRRR